MGVDAAGVELLPLESDDVEELDEPLLSLELLLLDELLPEDELSLFLLPPDDEYKSAYQPPPFKMKLPPLIRRWALLSWHFGQVSSAGSEIFCSSSQRFPQLLHWYSYVGMGATWPVRRGQAAVNSCVEWGAARIVAGMSSSPESPSLVVHPATAPLVGSVPVPSDKSIGHRAILFGALSTGRTHVRRLSFGEDNAATLAAFGAMGIESERVGSDELLLHGRGLYGLRAPSAALDCGNSGTTIRLLAGILAAQRFDSTMIGDASLMRRPMLRVATPLRARGARIDGDPSMKKPGEILPPLRIGALPEGQMLAALEWDNPVASAQVKSAVLLSGLYAAGPTHFREPSVSRDHTERMLTAFGVPVRTLGALIELDPKGWNGQIEPFELDVPGDPSAAAFLLAAGSMVAGSRITVRGVCTNPTRTGFLEAARDMGAPIAVEPQGDLFSEPVADLHVAHDGHSALRAGRLGGELVVRAVDEIPILVAMAARARGVTKLTDAEELRVKESDRLATMAVVLRAFGVQVEETDDGLLVEGKPEGTLRAAEVESRGDHRIAMSAAVLALAADAPSTIRDVACIATSFPRFVGTLRALGARIDVQT